MVKRVIRQTRNDKATSSNKINHPSPKIEGNDFDNDVASLLKTPDLSKVAHNPASILQLQRLLGNQAVINLLRDNHQAEPAHNPNGAIASPPLDTNGDHDSFSPREAAIQRRIEPLPGKSSGWFKGRRDKINEMVAAYNKLEQESSGPKSSVAGTQKLITEIQKIWQAANVWYLSELNSKPQKAQSILTWMKNQVETEEDAKKAQLGKLELKAAWDGASYNVLYTTEQYTDQNKGAGVRWLQTPAIAPIYRYYIIEKQFEGITLNAYDDVTRYRQNPSRAEALRIYQKYEMNAAKQLNITGEGVGGPEPIKAVRNQMAALAADPTAAPPANFGAIEQSLIYVINELFITFKETAQFKKVTTPPK